MNNAPMTLNIIAKYNGSLIKVNPIILIKNNPIDNPARLKWDKVSAIKLRRLITTKDPIIGVTNPIITPVIKAYLKNEYSNNAKKNDSFASNIIHPP
jgi:hypothetical protein